MAIHVDSEDGPKPVVGVAQSVGLVGGSRPDVARGLTVREAHERLAADGPNLMPEVGRRHPVLQLARQLTHLLALLLWAAAALAVLAGMPELAIAIVVIIAPTALPIDCVPCCPREPVSSAAVIPFLWTSPSSCAVTMCCLPKVTAWPPTCGCRRNVA